MTTEFYDDEIKEGEILITEITFKLKEKCLLFKIDHFGDFYIFIKAWVFGGQYMFKIDETLSDLIWIDPKELLINSIRQFCEENLWIKQYFEEHNFSNV